MDHSLDEGYAQAAARRRAAGRAGLPAGARARIWLAAGLALAALVVTLGAAHARDAAPTVAREREELLERVEAGTDDLDRLQGTVDALRADVAARQRAALPDDHAARADLVALLAGATAVSGPGLVLTVDDAEGTGQAAPGSPRDGGFGESGRVRDRDLQRIVNGLWGAGAEAISVNDQRLTALSAIRAAGDAVLVDNRPLVPPYTLRVVGGGEELAAAFAATPEGRYLQLLADDHGIGFSTEVGDQLRLPAAPSLTIRSASPVGAAEPATE
ncbi:DUF881 domain-containing protein [Streptomyces mayteni]